MNTRIITMLAAVSMAALISGGCANNEVVKTEEAPTVTARTDAAKQTEAAKQAEVAKAIEQQKAAAEANRIEPAKSVEAPVAAAPAVSPFETVYFDYDKAELRQDARNVLTKNAETMLKSKASAKVKIEGHCDERGSAEYNLALGERRAKSAMQYLLTLGVQPERLSVVSYGKEKPAVQGNDEAAWAKNRRAEFTIDK